MISVMMKQAEEAESTFGENEAWKSTLEKFLDQFNGGFPENHKQLENRLAQNEVILTGAVFEDQIKSIHREILSQNTRFLDGARPIPLGRITFSKMRNSILHDDMDRLVTGAGLVQARFFTMIVPVHLISNSCGKVSDGLQGYAWIGRSQLAQDDKEDVSQNCGIIRMIDPK